MTFEMEHELTSLVHTMQGTLSEILSIVHNVKHPEEVRRAWIVSNLRKIQKPLEAAERLFQQSDEPADADDKYREKVDKAVVRQEGPV